jgi:serralysin
MSDELYTTDDVVPADISIDPQGGTTHANGKPIWTPEQIAAYLNRSGGGFAGLPLHGPQSDSDLSVINFGFHTGQQSLFDNGYVYFVGQSGFGLSEYFNFAPMTEAQKAATREAMQSWDDVIAPSLVETNINDADIALGNLASAPTTQAYAYIPRNIISSNPAINSQVIEVGGDVWISASQASNFQLDEGRYGLQTIAHEVGHALGISHPGGYNAAPGLSITYPVNAEYAQDTRAYSIMSYFEASSLGARHFDFNVSTTAYAGVPLIHDILAAQRIYGADMTTRTGNDVYGFNTNIVGRDTFDFVKTPAPIGAIWDAGGIDTLDTSGFATTQLIDLRAGSLSSIGGVTFDTAPTYAQVLANRAAAGITTPLPLATYNANMAALQANPVVGRLTDNFGIAYGVTIENAIGGSGADTIFGNEVANVLTGNAGDDALNGLAGDDTLIGGIGADSMAGGIGNDGYDVDQSGDSVTEAAGEGTDTVNSSISYALGANLENLTLTGTAANGTGNELANIITGNASANVLDGGLGADSMIGGGGNDLYFVENGGDLVAELAGEGTDTVSSSISYTLGDNVENLILTGSATDGTGNGLNNVITGNGLSNRLNGGAGDDRLIGGDGVDFFTGGTGNDIFIGEINATKVASNNGAISLDVITDFAAGDILDLSGIDANTGLAGDQAFTLVNSANPKNAGEVSIRTFGNMNAAEAALGMDLDGVDGASPFAGPVSVLFGNVDGGAADFAIVFVGSPPLSTSDFMM